MKIPLGILWCSPSGLSIHDSLKVGQMAGCYALRTLVQPDLLRGLQLFCVGDLRKPSKLRTLLQPDLLRGLQSFCVGDRRKPMLEELAKKRTSRLPAMKPLPKENPWKVPWEKPRGSIGGTFCESLGYSGAFWSVRVRRTEHKTQ